MLEIANVGDSEATIVEFGIDIFFRANVAERATYVGRSAPALEF